MTALESPAGSGGAGRLPDADFDRVIRRGLWVLCAGFGGFLVWALLAPLDEGVPAPGVVSVETKRKRIDHLNGGIVEKILVREGERVKAGQPLIELNEVQAKAALNAAQSQWRVALATEALGLNQRIFNTQALCLVDLNRDGVLDMVFNNEGQESAVLLGNPALAKKGTTKNTNRFWSSLPLTPTSAATNKTNEKRLPTLICPALHD